MGLRLTASIGLSFPPKEKTCYSWWFVFPA
jgi:hypothetical protein